jgi:hypothetical protein
MFRSLLSSLMGLALLCQPALAQKKEEPKKDAVKKEEPKGQTVKVKSVDEKTGTLTVTTADGKTMTFKVNMDVKIVGPLGGVSKERLKDDRLQAGKEINVVLGADKKTLKEIRLTIRAAAPPKDKPNDKPKDK